jgi:hypothetical protein
MSPDEATSAKHGSQSSVAFEGWRASQAFLPSVAVGWKMTQPSAR